jgi:hypothetical protein
VRNPIPLAASQPSRLSPLHRQHTPSSLEWVRDPALGVLLGLFVAFILFYDPAHPVLLLVVALLASAVSWMLPPQVFLASSLALIGLSSVLETYAIHLGPATLYATDILVIVAVFRGLRPAERRPAPQIFGLGLTVAVMCWASLMLLAGMRASNAGESLVTIVRFETALLYFPLLFVSLSRILRERTLKIESLWGLLGAVSVAFVAWMFVMRILNMPFEGKSGVSQLGEVVTSQGSVVRRDFGAASAFIIYPVLGLAGVAALAHSRRRAAAGFLAFVGIAATFVTLIRGEIFGLTVGAVAILAVRSHYANHTSRLRAAVLLGVGSLCLLLALAYINPRVRDAVVERSLPGLSHESRAANQTAEYRMKALHLGISVARRHPTGIGFRNEQVLQQENIDPGYLGHSAPAWLLVFTGWPGLIASIAVLSALIARSFGTPASPRWAHPAFVGITLMMIVYGFGAAGLVGQPWVAALFAIVIALRFCSLDDQP